MITSVNNETIKFFKSLTTKKGQDLNKMFLVEGFHLVSEAYKKGLLVKVITTKPQSGFVNIEEVLVSDNVLKSLSSLKSEREIIGVVKIPEGRDFGKRIVLLDNVQDPENVGTLIRSALSFNMTGVFMSRGSCDIFNEKVIRGTQGAFFHIPCIRGDKLEFLNDLIKKGYKVIVTDLKSKNDIKDLSFKEPFVLVLGNEGKGVTEEVMNLKTVDFKLNQSENFDSLNVAVAGSIIMWYINECNK